MNQFNFFIFRYFLTFWIVKNRKLHFLTAFIKKFPINWFKIQINKTNNICSKRIVKLNWKLIKISANYSKHQTYAWNSTLFPFFWQKITTFRFSPFFAEFGEFQTFFFQISRSPDLSSLTLWGLMGQLSLKPIFSKLAYNFRMFLKIVSPS